MEVEISNSVDRDSYEILIRKRGEDEYASYCPQLNYAIYGKVHETVQDEMDKYIEDHIKRIKEANENSN